MASGTPADDTARVVTVRNTRREARLLGRLFLGAGAALLCGLSAPGQVWIFLTALLASIGAVLTAEARDPEPWGWRLDDTGLHEYLFGGRWHSHDRGALRLGAVRRDAFTIETGQGRVTVPRSLPQAEAMLRRLRTAADQRVTPAAVPPELLAEWLGIAIDEALEAPRDVHRPATLAVLTAILGGEALWLGTSFGVAYALPAFLLLALVLVAQLAQERARLTVTPHGFYRGGRKVGDWADVEAPLHGGAADRVLLRGRTLTLSAEQREPVTRAVTNLLAARRAGAVVSRMADVPDTAVSLAGEPAERLELGLSRAEPPDRR